MTKESRGKEIFHDPICSDLELCKTWYDCLDNFPKTLASISLRTEDIEKLQKCFELLINYLSGKENKVNDERIAW